ncbi:hypothetical protein ABT336_07645 [Micromonospora sp. NPDC000207]|uniref:hypothetical protein n=1 Tax=Micromonospora sp. NPDC000207 TaxID=3154246 RepID=UPI00331CA23F
MRGRVWWVAAVVLLATGCAQESDERVTKPPVPPMDTPQGVAEPAASAGGACELLDFAKIEEHAGVRFDVAAAGERNGSHTCVVRAGQDDLPELTLSVSKTSLDRASFAADVVPQQAETVSGLGQQAYRRTVAASDGDGPVAEVGWLADQGRLAILRYTLPADAERSAAQELAGKLTELAKSVEVKPL